MTSLNTGHLITELFHRVWTQVAIVRNFHSQLIRQPLPCSFAIFPPVSRLLVTFAGDVSVVKVDTNPLLVLVKCILNLDVVDLVDLGASVCLRQRSVLGDGSGREGLTDALGSEQSLVPKTL